MRKFFNSGGHDMKVLTIVLVILWLIYLVLTFLAPAAETTGRYGISVAQTNILRFTIIVPILFIWATQWFSIGRFSHYYKLVKDSTEGEAFRKIVIGLWMLLMVLVLPSLVSAIASYWPNSSYMLESSTILRNYLSIFFYLWGFWYLWQASRDLYHTVASGLPSNSYRIPILLGVLLLTILNIIAVFHNPFRTVSSDPFVRPTYYLPDMAIFVTIVIPYFFIWLFGGLTILNLLTYTKKVQGSIYRYTFSWFAYGLTVTIVLLVGLTFLSQANAALNHAALKVILVLIYLLLLAIAVGYLLIARGARKLTAIEEVK